MIVGYDSHEIVLIRPDISYDALCEDTGDDAFHTVIWGENRPKDSPEETEINHENITAVLRLMLLRGVDVIHLG
jgi:hypothetical protein